MEILSLFADLIGIVGGVFATLVFFNQRTARRLAMEAITIVVRYGKEELLLPYRPLRGQLSRAELLGVLGLFAGAARFETAQLIPVLTSGALNRVLTGQDSILTIEVDEKFFGAVKANLAKPAA